MTPELHLLQCQVSYRADYITPDFTGGTAFAAHMLRRFLLEEITPLYPKDAPQVIGNDPLDNQKPSEDQWVIAHNSDINDTMGEGLSIHTGRMHWLLNGPVAMVNLTKFIREHGVTDTSCRFRITYHLNGLRNLDPVKFLFMLDEGRQIEVWSRFAQFTRRSHQEMMAAQIHTNLYWQSAEKWFEERHHAIDGGTGYAIDFRDLRDDQLHVDLVQGPHYEHRYNSIGNLMSEIGEAFKETASTDNQDVFAQRMAAFWTLHAEKRHQDARWKSPG